MNKIWNSIRFQMMQICVIFTLIISLGLGYVSYAAFEREQRRNMVQSVEFNLNLVTNLVMQDISNLDILANLCATTPSALTYFSAANPTAKQRLDAYEKIQAHYSSSRSATYVQRLILTDGGERIIQVGSGMVDGAPVTPYNVLEFPYIQSEEGTHWQTITRDPLARPSYADTIPIVQPIYSRGQVRCGTLYMSVSTEIITDQFAKYQLPEGDQLYISMGDTSWRIEQKTLTQETLDFGLSKPVSDIAIDRETLVADYRDATGSHYMTVSCPIGNTGIWLTHCFASDRFDVPPRILYLQFFVGLAVVQTLGLMVIFLLNRIIVRPVNRLRERMAEISAGSFEPDVSVEWNNELGDIGRGINQMAMDFQTMMDNRVSAEKERQRLEYKMLQSQISPHFIYNTLNSIKWMATLQKATGIAEMTGALSRLLKHLSKCNDDLIPLREELSLLSDYCVIQQYRYGCAIALEVAPVEEEALYDCLIPRFTLQPLVENAIFHGIEPNGGIGSVQVRIEDMKNGNLCIEVQDDGVGMSEETIRAIFSQNDEKAAPKFRQIGVRNVHQRIQYAFGEHYGISIDSTPGNGTRMVVHIPRKTLSGGVDDMR